jgi:hypothetical protein
LLHFDNTVAHGHSCPAQTTYNKLKQIVEAHAVPAPEAIVVHVAEKGTCPSNSRLLATNLPTSHVLNFTQQSYTLRRRVHVPKFSAACNEPPYKPCFELHSTSESYLLGSLILPLQAPPARQAHAESAAPMAMLAIEAFLDPLVRTPRTLILGAIRMSNAIPGPPHLHPCPVTADHCYQFSAQLFLHFSFYPCGSRRTVGAQVRQINAPSECC